MSAKVLYVSLKFLVKLEESDTEIVNMYSAHICVSIESYVPGLLSNVTMCVRLTDKDDNVILRLKFENRNKRPTLDSES